MLFDGWRFKLAFSSFEPVKNSVFTVTMLQENIIIKTSLRNFALGILRLYMLLGQ